VLWLREWYKSTKFFHCVANSNKRGYIVEKLVMNGDISSNPADIKDHIIHFFLLALHLE
jgi:hypothetical protein